MQIGDNQILMVFIYFSEKQPKFKLQQRTNTVRRTNCSANWSESCNVFQNSGRTGKVVDLDATYWSFLSLLPLGKIRPIAGLDPDLDPKLTVES